jgi:hypothetical protein
VNQGDISEELALQQHERLLRPERGHPRPSPKLDRCGTRPSATDHARKALLPSVAIPA